MRILCAAGTVAAVIMLAPTAALAQDRTGDAAMGAVSGLVVGGPIGAVVGGVIGYTEGPNIAHGMDIDGRHARYDRYGSRHYTYHDTGSRDWNR